MRGEKRRVRRVPDLTVLGTAGSRDQCERELELLTVRDKSSVHGE